MKVLIVHGYDDLSCPYFVSRLVIDQMPITGDPNRVKLVDLSRRPHVLLPPRQPGGVPQDVIGPLRRADEAFS